MLAAAICSAVMEEPHRRLTVWAGTLRGIPVMIAALRAMFMDCSRVWLTQPQITSSTSLGSSPALRVNSDCITAAERFSARTWRKAPFFALAMAVRTPSTTTISLGFKLIVLILLFVVVGSGLGRGAVEGLAGGGHLAQPLGGGVERPQLLGEAVGQLDEGLHAHGIDIAQRAAAEGREADAVDQRHVRLGGAGDDVILQAAHGLQAERHHHAADDLLVGELAGLPGHALDQLDGGLVAHLLRLALAVLLVGVEALVVLLAQTLVLEHHLDGALALAFPLGAAAQAAHALREALGHHLAGVHGGVHAHHVEQVGGAHGPRSEEHTSE